MNIIYNDEFVLITVQGRKAQIILRSRFFKIVILTQKSSCCNPNFLSFLLLLFSSLLPLLLFPCHRLFLHFSPYSNNWISVYVQSLDLYPNSLLKAASSTHLTGFFISVMPLPISVYFSIFLDLIFTLPRFESLIMKFTGWFAARPFSPTVVLQGWKGRSKEQVVYIELFEERVSGKCKKEI